MTVTANMQDKTDETALDKMTTMTQTALSLASVDNFRY